VSYLAYVSFLHSQPPDELAMASDLSYQATIGLVVVGLPALAFLFLFLFVGQSQSAGCISPNRA